MAGSLWPTSLSLAVDRHGTRAVLLPLRSGSLPFNLLVDLRDFLPLPAETVVDHDQLAVFNLGLMDLRDETGRFAGALAVQVGATRVEGPLATVHPVRR